MSRFTHAHDPLLGPPAHVLAEVDAAWERAQELVAGELELHFTRALLGAQSPPTKVCMWVTRPSSTVSDTLTGPGTQRGALQSPNEWTDPAKMAFL